MDEKEFKYSNDVLDAFRVILEEDLAKAIADDLIGIPDPNPDTHQRGLFFLNPFEYCAS